MTWQATLGERITNETADALVLRLAQFTRRHGLDVNQPVNELPPARLWAEVINAIPPDSPLYRSAVRVLNRAITGRDGTYWHSLWHDTAHPNRPQPMRYL